MIRRIWILTLFTILLQSCGSFASASPPIVDLSPDSDSDPKQYTATCHRDACSDDHIYAHTCAAD